MANTRDGHSRYATALGRLILGVVLFLLAVIFITWRIDNPRVERIRTNITDRIVPSFAWVAAPITAVSELVGSFQSYAKLYNQNQELRRELQQMKGWKEVALQKEQENARLLDLNNVRLDPKFTHITGVVLADSGSPYRQTVLLNVGRRDGIVDGWAAMDGLGLVGRLAGVGEQTSRVLMLGDSSSRVAVTIEPAGQRALIVGDNTSQPTVEFLENPELVRPGDRVVTSGDGQVFPPGLVVGQITVSPSGRMRVLLSADIQRLEFLRVIRHSPTATVNGAGGLINATNGETADGS